MSRRLSLLVWALAVAAATAAFVVHLSIRLETVALGYEVGRARTADALLVEKRRVLTIEAATLRAPQRVERIARDTLGMSVPGHDRIRLVGRVRAKRLASGRIQ